MPTPSLKDKRTELEGRIRDLAKTQDPVALVVIELVRTMFEEAKESLVTADGNDMLRKQGAARQLEKFYTELTTTPPSITKP